MRLTIDIDSWWFTDLQRTIIRALNLGLPFPNVIRRSPSGRGYHVIWRGLNITEKQALQFRLELGDDPLRVKFDSERPNKPKQVLFRKKKIIEIPCRR